MDRCTPNFLLISVKLGDGLFSMDLRISSFLARVKADDEVAMSTVVSSVNRLNN